MVSCPHSVSVVGDKLSLDDILIVCAIYPAIAKKSAYPYPASLSKNYLTFMKYVKKVYVPFIPS